MKAEAAVLYKINRPLEIEELTVPKLREGQVLVEITYSGICHSQLNEINGLKGEDRFLPHTLGHEGAGVVMEVGPDVDKVKPGDRVVLTWIKGEGHDVPSTQYTRPDGSIVNSGAISTFMTHAVISENRLVGIANEMPLREAALLGCAIPTGGGIVMNTAKLRPGQSIAIFGLGGIGLSAILIADYINANTATSGNGDSHPKVIAIDIVNQKLSIAREIGATHIINANNEDPIKAVMDLTSGQGVDYTIEAAGLRQTMEQAFQCVRDKGGLCVLAGNLPQGETISIDPFDLIKGKRIMGTWGGETVPDRDIPKYVGLYHAGKLKLDQVITDTFAFDEINTVIEMMSKGQIVGRCLIEMPKQEGLIG